MSTLLSDQLIQEEIFRIKHLIDLQLLAEKKVLPYTSDKTKEKFFNITSFEPKILSEQTQVLPSDTYQTYMKRNFPDLFPSGTQKQVRSEFPKVDFQRIGPSASDATYVRPEQQKPFEPKVKTDFSTPEVKFEKLGPNVADKTYVSKTIQQKGKDLKQSDELNLEPQKAKLVKPNETKFGDFQDLFPKKQEILSPIPFKNEKEFNDYKKGLLPQLDNQRLKTFSDEKNINLLDTKKPEKPSYQLSVSSSDFKGPRNLEYIRYEGKDKGYIKYVFSNTKENIEKFNNLYTSDLKKWELHHNKAYRVVDWFYSFDKHDWAMFIDITTGILSLVPSPAQPFFAGVSLIASLADAKMYYDDGDTYMAGLILAFSVIPAHQLIEQIPGLEKIIISKTPKGIVETLEKAKNLKKVSTEVLTDAQKQIIKDSDEIIKKISKNADKLGLAVSKVFVTDFFNQIIKAGGKKLLKTTLLLSKFLLKIGKGVGKIGVIIGGIYYTYDEIYLALYGSDEEKMKIRYDSGFQELIRVLKIVSNVESVEKQASEFLLRNKKLFEENPEKLAWIDPESQKDLEIKTEKITSEVPNKEVIKSPSFEDILSKKIDPTTNLPFVMKRGQKGTSVGKLQKLLMKLNFENQLKGYSKDQIKPDDNIFGENTELSVQVFQNLNDLKETGIVDYETLKKIIEKTK